MSASEPSGPPAVPPPCYLHPDRPALLRCSRCERPICGQDAIEAPVGYQCRQCAQGAIPARSLRALVVEPRITQILVAAIAVLYVVSQVDLGAAFSTFGLIPIFVGAGEWWRLITGALLHANLMHVAFNGILLWRLGSMLESALGHHRFAALFAVGLAGGSFGVMALSWLTVASGVGAVPIIGQILATSPRGVTVGASGAVFGLMGVAIVGMRQRGINPWRTDIGTLVLLNLVITVLFSTFISVGGHVGGLLAGLAAGRVVFGSSQRGAGPTVVVWVVTGLLLAVAVVLGVAGNEALFTRMLR